MTEQTSSESPVVLRYAGMFPDDLAGYETHRARKGGDLGHVAPNPSRPNRILIGPEDWAAQTREMINGMKAENFADELETLTRRRRTSQIRKRMAEGPRDPWRPTRHGPLREVILTANRSWFEGFEMDGGGHIDFRKRERAFEARAVAWLKESFGEDVVHARADVDEAAYHIHAVIVPKVRVDLNGAKRWMLQPSKHPMIKDYEAAQDSVGAWFKPIGLVRGERRAAAVRAARRAGQEPPSFRQHARTSEWRAARELEIGKAAGRVEAREADCARAEADIAAREAAVAGREAAALDDERRLARERERLIEARKTATAEAEEADAILAVADGLAGGAIELVDDDDAPRLATVRGANPGAAKGLVERIARSPLGRSRAVRAFSAAFGKLRANAKAEAAAEVSRDVAEIRRADAAIVEIASAMPPQERRKIIDIRGALTRSITALRGRPVEPRPQPGAPRTPDQGVRD